MATWDADGKLPDHTALLGSSCSHRCVPVLAKVWPPDIDSVPHYGRYKHVVPWLQRLRRAMMTIGQAARQAGCGVETIRFYERQGLIERPAKPAVGFRRYPSEIVDRVRFIRQAQGLGFSLREIDELLSLRTDPAADCADVRSRASAKLDEVVRKIA